MTYLQNGVSYKLKICKLYRLCRLGSKGDSFLLRLKRVCSKVLIVKKLNDTTIKDIETDNRKVNHDKVKVLTVI